MVPILILMAAAAAGQAAPYTPTEAIALADAHPERGTTGVFTMTVAAAERRPDAVFLNSSADYRSSDDVTFRLTPAAAHVLEKRLGARPEAALVGRVVTVRGQIRARPVANLVAGQPRSLNRYQHVVWVRQADQLTVR